MLIFNMSFPKLRNNCAILIGDSTTIIILMIVTSVKKVYPDTYERIRLYYLKVTFKYIFLLVHTYDKVNKIKIISSTLVSQTFSLAKAKFSSIKFL